VKRDDPQDLLVRELTRLYRALDKEIAALGWRCRACGECCRFARHGHQLFCSQVEAEWLAGPAELSVKTDDDVCMFLDGARCTRRRRRTLGCRTYFCQAPSEQMSTLAETCLARLKSLHERLGMPWRYDRLSSHLARRNTMRHKE
jgi:Fe-S-cluster containining protein